MNDDVKDNLAVRVAADPQLQKLFTRLKDPQYYIPNDYETTLKQIGDIRPTEKGTLVSKVTTPEDLQTQLRLLSGVQNCLDHTHELNTSLYILQAKWKELYNAGLQIVMLNYFNELNDLKDGVRKIVVSIALQPIQTGIDRLEHLIELGERSHKHLTATNWNVKKASEIIQEYLSIFKYGSSVRLTDTDI